VIENSNSGFVRYVDTRESTLGFVFLLVKGAIPWRIVKQSIVTASTMKAGIITCLENIIYVNWLQSFISRLGIVDNIVRLLKMYCDNFATIFFSKNDKYSKGATSRKRSFKVGYGSPLNVGSLTDVESGDIESIQIRRQFSNRHQIFTHHVGSAQAPAS